MIMLCGNFVHTFKANVFLKTNNSDVFVAPMENVIQ